MPRRRADRSEQTLRRESAAHARRGGRQIRRRNGRYTDAEPPFFAERRISASRRSTAATDANGFDGRHFHRSAGKPGRPRCRKQNRTLRSGCPHMRAAVFYKPKGSIVSLPDTLYPQHALSGGESRIPAQSRPAAREPWPPLKNRRFPQPFLSTCARFANRMANRESNRKIPPAARTAFAPRRAIVTKNDCQL